LGSSSKKTRQYTDGEIDMIREHFKQSMLKTKVEPEFEIYPDDWCVYSWNHGEEIEAMHPHDALLLELQGHTVTNMTDKHGMRPAHLKKVEREEQMRKHDLSVQFDSPLKRKDKHV